MTFEQGEIVYLGLEEKNRALLGWPRVAVVRPHFSTDQEFTERLASLGKAVADWQQETTPAAVVPAPAAASAPEPAAAPAQRPSATELLPTL
jgi:hypothetical protein